MRALPTWVGWAACTFAASNLARADEAAPIAVNEGASSASASDSCVGERYVLVELADEFEVALGAEVLTDLAAELQHRGIGLCSTRELGPEPLASVQLRELPSPSRTIVIDLDDHLTHKRVARDLTVAQLPANGRALAVAIAIDELLRASWAELTLRRDDPDTSSSAATARPPALPSTAMDEPPRSARWSLAADAGYLRGGRDFGAFALQGRASLGLGRRGFVELAVGGVSSLPAASSYGEVVARGLTGSLAGGACSERSARAYGCFGARAELAWFSVRGIRPQLAEARSGHAALVSSSLVALLGTPLSVRVHLFGELGVGAFLRGLDATDGSDTVMAISGLLLSLRAGVRFVL